MDTPSLYNLSDSAPFHQAYLESQAYMAKRKRHRSVTSSHSESQSRPTPPTLLQPSDSPTDVLRRDPHREDPLVRYEESREVSDVQRAGLLQAMLLPLENNGNDLSKYLAWRSVDW